MKVKPKLSKKKKILKLIKSIKPKQLSCRKPTKYHKVLKRKSILKRPSHQHFLHGLRRNNNRRTNSLRNITRNKTQKLKKILNIVKRIRNKSKHNCGCNRNLKQVRFNNHKHHSHHKLKKKYMHNPLSRHKAKIMQSFYTNIDGKKNLQSRYVNSNNKGIHIKEFKNGIVREYKLKTPTSLYKILNQHQHPHPHHKTLQHKIRTLPYLFS